MRSGQGSDLVLSVLRERVKIPPPYDRTQSFLEFGRAVLVAEKIRIES